MGWEVRNVGWPVPYGDTWPISSKQQKSPEPWPQPYPTQHQIVVYGYNWFGPNEVKGTKIDVWI